MAAQHSHSNMFGIFWPFEQWTLMLNELTEPKLNGFLELVWATLHLYMLMRLIAIYSYIHMKYHIDKWTSWLKNVVHALLLGYLVGMSELTETRPIRILKGDKASDRTCPVLRMIVACSFRRDWSEESAASSTSKLALSKSLKSRREACCCFALRLDRRRKNSCIRIKKT